MPNIGNIVVTFSGDATKFFSTVDKVQLVSNALGSFLGTTFAGMTESAINSLLGTVDASLKTAAAMELTSSKTRLSVESLSAMQYQADQTGLAFKSISTELQGMTTGLITQNQKQLEAFDKLGVKVKDTSGQLRPMKDIVNDLSTAFSKSTDLSLKNAATLSSGQNDLIRLLNQGGSALKDYELKAASAGEIMSTKTAIAAAALQQNLQELQKQAGTLGGELATAVVPVLASVTGHLQQMKIQSSAAGTDFTALTEIIRDLAKDVIHLGTGALQTAAILSGVAQTVKYFATQEFISKDLSEIWTPVINRLHDLENGMLNWKASIDENTPVLVKHTKDLDHFNASADEHAKKIKAILDGLKQEVATYGMVADEVKLYELGVLGASAADVKKAQAMVDQHQDMMRLKDDYDELNATIKASIDLEEQTTAAMAASMKSRRNSIAGMFDIPKESKDLFTTQGESMAAFAKMAHDLRIELMNAQLASQGLQIDTRALAISESNMPPVLKADMLATLGLINARNGANVQLDVLRAASNRFATELTHSLENAIFNFQGLGNLFKSLGKDVADLVVKIGLLKPLENWLTGAFSGLGGGGFFGVLGSLLHIPGFAGGGNFEAGQPFFAGENGPELIVPSTSGSVVPNGSFGGGGRGYVVMNFDLRGNTNVDNGGAERIAAAVEGRAVIRALGAIRETNLRRA